VEKSTCVTSRSIRGRNHILVEFCLAVWGGSDICKPVERSVILPGGDLVVCGRGIVSPRLFRQDLLGDVLVNPLGRPNNLRGTDMTSKSWRLRISSSGGRLETRSCRAFSSSVISTTTFSTVSGSTGPRLGRMRRAEILDCICCSLLFGRQIRGNRIWWMYRVVFFPGGPDG
jgi:hypothetical protein